ncbi:threonine/serine dehydratase [Roseiconus nitratireducens]|uniref:Threonine/serine dehydratase n=1 Tax=Roseiconus nitratireducens TaxID=2605748 RepID=A0A5M6CWH3_9BACT|nr:threonine/serine dehydratase [Roseiconus nitratireducens]KAA5539316.1 threonine/serine dehydratase [Roseiconus nitratireducens]
MNVSFAIDSDDVHRAAERIRGHVLRTPCIGSESLSQLFGCDVSFKAENLQHVGAFKARGAVNAVRSLSDDQAACGVVTHSSGNHAAALARAAQQRGIKAFVVMPRDSSPNKLDAVRGYGVEPILCEPTTESRHQTAERVRQETGATLVHPYDDPQVIAGQGTVGLEILEQVHWPDVILVPVGGGGLLAGILSIAKATRPDVRVIAVEPAWADDTARSLQAGSPQPVHRYDTVADGLRTSVGTLTFPIIQQYVDDLLLVSEQAILSATRMLAERVRLVAEPSGAVTLAGLVENADRFAGQRVVAVVSGGNLSFGHCTLGQV